MKKYILALVAFAVVCSGFFVVGFLEKTLTNNAWYFMPTLVTTFITFSTVAAFFVFKSVVLYVEDNF